MAKTNYSYAKHTRELEKEKKKEEKRKKKLAQKGEVVQEEDTNTTEKQSLSLSVSRIQYKQDYTSNKFKSKERLWQKVKILKNQLRKHQQKA